VSVKSLHVLGTVQTGAPSTEPVVFVTSVSVYVMVGLAGLSVPLAAGDGASGAFGPAGEPTDSVVGDVVTGVFFSVAIVRVVSLAGEVAAGVALFESEVARFVRANDSDKNTVLVRMRVAATSTRQFDFLISIRI
jgi:hypothetical protein